MNFYDLFKGLFDQYQAVEEILDKLKNENKKKSYQQNSTDYYQEIIQILDSEIKDLTSKLNEKVNLKKEFEKKVKESYDYQKSNHHKERNKKHSDESYSSRGKSYGHQKTYYDDKIAKYYAALEIPYGSNFETVKKAYRTLLKKYHPDYYHSNPDKQKTATLLTQKLSEAYQALEKHLNLKK